VLKPGDTVIYESTVYPGATEEICVPELQSSSGLRFNEDFFVGYSPERINPGDRQRRLVDIPKVTSGSTPATADFVDALYREIIPAGTHKASSLRVAEAAKVIENTQRDANIALINEFALIFQRLGIDTTEVLEAAGTKWNFLPFRPGLVGGHCIGVDPYYLIQKAQAAGYLPGHPACLPSHQRRDGRACRERGDQADDPARHRRGRIAHPDPRHHLQGKTARTCAIRAWSSWRASSASTARRSTSTTRGPMPMKPGANTASDCSRSRSRALTTR
jgi:hypothetical protein